MRGETIPIRDLSENDIGAWRELARTAIEPNPFFEPNFILPLASGLNARDVRLIVVRDRMEWYACLPFRLSRWRRIPLPAAISWRPSHSPLGTPLLAPRDPEAAIDSLLTALHDLPRCSYALLEWIGEDGLVSRALGETLDQRSLEAIPLERFERATIKKAMAQEQLESGMSKRSRRRLARKRDALQEELGEPVETRDWAGHSGAYDEFLQLEASGWKGRAGTALASDPGTIRFFREMCRAFEAEGRLELLGLGGERMVAAQCNLISQNILFNLKIAYDERWAKFSPGIQLDVDALARLQNRTDVDKIDSCASPTNDTLNQLLPGRKRLITLALPKRGVAGTPVRPLIAANRAARKARELASR